MIVRITYKDGTTENRKMTEKEFSQLFMKEFYDAGSIRGSSTPFGPKDIKQFADSLNNLCS